jgi:crossover junction endodeoxyribonuclease RusA
MFSFELPYPPSINHYWRRVGPRTLISRQGRKFRQDVEVAVRRKSGLRGKLPMLGHLAVEVLLCPPDRRRRDLDNTLKATLDALQHAGVYQDDSQIADLAIRRCEPCDGGCAIVRITPIETLLGHKP